MIKPLSVDKLYNHCDLKIFDFKTTAELEELDEIIGQSRALKAISFGIGIKKEGYNLYAMGKLGSGKHSVVEKFIQSRAKDEKKPGDWCYVNNFEVGEMFFTNNMLCFDCISKSVGATMF